MYKAILIYQLSYKGTVLGVVACLSAAVLLAVKTLNGKNRLKGNDAQYGLGLSGW